MSVISTATSAYANTANQTAPRSVTNFVAPDATNRRAGRVIA
ncbi:MAG: hypothetical protein Q8P42_01805 [Gallionella sp.]|nr:hypothetical protein [Gallionella sp.]